MISLREYAKHRGVSAMTVSKAVKSGRLRESVTRDEHDQPKIADVALADREWLANSNYTDKPSALAAMRPELRDPGTAAAPREPNDLEAADSMLEATRREKWAKAHLAELKLKQEQGELVPAAKFTQKLTDVFLEVRTKLLALPSRARLALPELSSSQLGTLETLVREALEELAAEGEP